MLTHVLKLTQISFTIPRGVTPTITDANFLSSKFASSQLPFICQITNNNTPNLPNDATCIIINALVATTNQHLCLNTFLLLRIIINYMWKKITKKEEEKSYDWETRNDVWNEIDESEKKLASCAKKKLHVCFLVKLENWTINLSEKFKKQLFSVPISFVSFWEIKLNAICSV